MNEFASLFIVIEKSAQNMPLLLLHRSKNIFVMFILCTKSLALNARVHARAKACTQSNINE